MYYIDEMYPWTVIDQRKYMLYLKLRKERDKFLKSLREISYCDWLIDKKLVEAGGLGKTVYILPARGGGTSFRTLRRINDFIEEGRDVQFVTTRKPESTWKKGMVLDWDLCCNRENQAMYAEIDRYIHEQILQRFYEDVVKDLAPEQRWSITAWPDAYIYSSKTYSDWAMRDFLLNPHYGIVYKKDDDTYFGGVVI